MLWLRHVDTALFVCMLRSSLGLCLHITVEGCHSIRYPMCASRYFHVVDVLIMILDLIVFARLSRDGSFGRLFAVNLSVAPGMLLVGRRALALLRCV